ncbi:hypothetical protein Tco_1235620 [Tanacetum coccineum]
MATHTERMENFEEAIYRQRKEINERMTEMFSLLKEYTKGKAPEKILVKEESSNLVTKYINAISLIEKEGEEVEEYDEVIDIEVVEQSECWVMKELRKRRKLMKMNWIGVETITQLDGGKNADRLIEMPKSHLIGYYLKHDINRKTIKDLVDNNEYNDAFLKTRLGKMDREVYESLPVGPLYDAVLKMKLVKKKRRRWPFEINVILSLANHSYVYPVGIAEDVLVEVAGSAYPIDFAILNIEENEYMPLILGDTISNYDVREKKRNDLDPLIPTIYVNRRILEWEERIENCKEDEIEFGKWRSKVFDNKNPVGHSVFIYDHELEKEDGSSMTDDGVT